MAHDRHGRRLTSRGGSPTLPLTGDEVTRVTPRTCFTDPSQRPLRSRTGGPQVGGGPRLPRNKMGSLSTAIDRSNSANTLQYLPSESRVPPVVKIASENRLKLNSRLGTETPLNTKTVKRPSIPGYRARCIDDCDSDDDVQTDYYRESSIKTNPAMSTFITSPQTMKQNMSLNLSITPQKQQETVIEQQMDTLQSPISPDNSIATGQSIYDPETYQKHLDDIKRKATEWSRLQEGLALLLPNTDGDT